MKTLLLLLLLCGTAWGQCTHNFVDGQAMGWSCPEGENPPVDGNIVELTIMVQRLEKRVKALEDNNKECRCFNIGITSDGVHYVGGSK